MTLAQALSIIRKHWQALPHTSKPATTPSGSGCRRRMNSWRRNGSASQARARWSGSMPPDVPLHIALRRPRVTPRSRSYRVIARTYHSRSKQPLGSLWIHANPLRLCCINRLEAERSLAPRLQLTGEDCGRPSSRSRLSNAQAREASRCWERAGRGWGSWRTSDTMACIIHLPLEPGEAPVCVSNCNSSY